MGSMLQAISDRNVSSLKSPPPSEGDIGPRPNIEGVLNCSLRVWVPYVVVLEVW
eukprot:CAMPEP_0201918592 /NCGR_PEP_ID=MMETSP0903-20130614/7701_1 /ASSEMBLY_ACC=CAM_ASM_000552 /TAXON_ID=420261 /ORGANISM="Thalassiosira antarctica, Strain CCMP982" /LENGTH=53 /DNA_ID=CAMNT_0048454927 /DNA_START=68 /DNA_END=226 /DNA_ORIENTATION=-